MCRDQLSGPSLLVSRTGYTGELGYEFYLPSGLAGELWSRLIEIGRPKGLKPAGLGARDLLRLEMAYLLYGNDINQETTPLEAGAEWVVRFEKGEFIGREALLRQQAGTLSTRLIAFELLEKAVPRHGFTITEGTRRLSPSERSRVAIFHHCYKKASASATCRSRCRSRGRGFTLISEVNSFLQSW